MREPRLLANHDRRETGGWMVASLIINLCAEQHVFIVHRIHTDLL